MVTGKTLFSLKHTDTNKYLSTDRKADYNNQNCPRCPIVGHMEVAAANNKNTNTWRVHSGFFYPEI